MELIVARIDRAQGLKGEVALTVRSDRPEQRLAVGAELHADAPEVDTLTVASARTYKGRWYVRFEEVTDRNGAEALRGINLSTDAEASDEENAWYPHELEGLRVELPDGTVAGTVIGLEQFPAQDMLVIAERPGGRTLIPFVRQIVPVVAPEEGRVVIDPPGGLLEADSANLDSADGGQESGSDAD
ncbi:16S rRNA processing protein RimM [Micrococcales bacterium KH10]|nr:16S rRNA processing protein RimM [Micrococcales bacterium KH10]